LSGESSSVGSGNTATRSCALQRFLALSFSITFVSQLGNNFRPQANFKHRNNNAIGTDR
jgi:hypothetical protein